MEVKAIEDEDGNIVVELIDDKVLDGGEHFEWWDGRDDSGEFVSLGDYDYKINARNPETGELEDSETGQVSAKYAAEIVDFEGDCDSHFVNLLTRLFFNIKIRHY